MKIATIRVSGVTASVDIHSKIPAGIIGATVELAFPDPYWAGLVKNVKFKGAVEVPPILGVGNTVTIPASLVAVPNERLEIGIIGVAADGETEITPTLWADLGVVRPSAGYIPKNNGQESGGNTEGNRETLENLSKKVEELDKEVEDLKKSSSGSGITVTDDGVGNVTISTGGSAQITDDGNGNIVIS